MWCWRGGFFLAIANDKIINNIKTKLPKSTITKINIDFEGIVSRNLMKYNQNIFVAGHNGMVGSAIQRRLKKLGFKNIFTA